MHLKQCLHSEYKQVRSKKHLLLVYHQIIIGPHMAHKNKLSVIHCLSCKWMLTFRRLYHYDQLHRAIFQSHSLDPLNTLCPLLFMNTLICFYNINFPHLIASNGAVCLNMQWAGNKFSGFRFSHRTQSAISLQSEIQNTLGVRKKRGFLNWLSWCDPTALGCQSSLFQHGHSH